MLLAYPQLSDKHALVASSLLDFGINYPPSKINVPSLVGKTSTNTEYGLQAGYTALDDEYERKHGLVKPAFSLGPGFMSGTPDGKFACAEIEVFAMKPQEQQA